jgi:hypothetical protein
MIMFDKVEVVNRLRADMVYDTIKNYTTNYGTKSFSCFYTRY